MIQKYDKNTLIDWDELPIINGRRIHSIYAMGFFYNTTKLVDAPIASKIDCYVCHTKDRKFVQGVYVNLPDVKLKILPPVFAELFKHTTSLWYRTDNSGNGSFIDGSIYMKNYTVYRGV